MTGVTPEPVNSTILGAAAEHYVMCQLLRRGMIAALAPAGVPDADIIVSNRLGSALAAVQVKARRDIGSDGGWHMKAKHERMDRPLLFYSFVDFHRYDAFVSLETLAALIASPDPLRLAYRRGIVERALTKKASTGVQVPDPAMRHLKEAYLRHASEWCAREELDLTFPTLRDAYYDGDNWVDGIRHPALPVEVRLRHRLWTTSKEMCGLVDLIMATISESDRRAITVQIPEGARVAPYSKGKGIQVSFPVAELRQRTGFDDRIAGQAFESMRRLVAWYRTKPA